MNHRLLAPLGVSASLALVVAFAAAPVARAGDDAPKAPAAMPEGDPMKPQPPAPASDERRGRFFDTYDANADGKVTKDEYTGDAALFDLLDTDHDGLITLAEIGAPADYKPRPMDKPRDEAGPDMKGGERLKRLERWKLKVSEWDVDHDGKVTKEEYEKSKGADKSPFDRLDSNKDGVITVEDGPGAGRGEKGAPGAPMSAEEAMGQFKNADKNGDGKVTKDEFAGPPERFATLDRDSDGALTPEEIRGALRDMVMGGKGGKGTFQRFDKNGDGKVTRDEWMGGDEGFQRLDKNADGVITPEEAEMARGLGGGKPGKGEPGSKGDGSKGDGPMAPPTTADGGMAPSTGLTGLFAALDKDHDGRLSRAEFVGSDDAWRQLDRNQDGWISADEAK